MMNENENSRVDVAQEIAQFDQEVNPDARSVDEDIWGSLRASFEGYDQEVQMAALEFVKSLPQVLQLVEGLGTKEKAEGWVEIEPINDRELWAILKDFFLEMNDGTEALMNGFKQGAYDADIKTVIDYWWQKNRDRFFQHKKATESKA